MVPAFKGITVYERKPYKKILIIGYTKCYETGMQETEQLGTKQAGKERWGLGKECFASKVTPKLKLGNK